jgi:hypothetical protein
VSAAEGRLKAVRKWIREFDEVFGPDLRVLELLRERMANDLGEASADLARTLRLLAEYSDAPPPPRPTGEPT